MNFIRTTNQASVPFVAGISFKTAPVEVREKMAISQHALACTGDERVDKAAVGLEYEFVVYLQEHQRLPLHFGREPAIDRGLEIGAAQWPPLLHIIAG